MSDFLRLVLGLLTRLALLACILAGAAFVPAVQTWAAQWELARHPGLHTSASGFWAGFGRMRAVDVHVATREGELTLPEVDARLPLLSAWTGRRLRIRHLTAQGWTLKVARSVEGGMEAVAVQGAAATVAGALDRLRLPCDLESLDGLEAEGDVVFPLVAGESRKVHVKLAGGGLAPGHPGAFALSVTGLAGDDDPPRVLFAAQGRLEAAMDTPRTVQRLAFSSDLSGGPSSGLPGAAAEIAAAREAGGETYSLLLTRTGRTLAQLAGRYSPADRRLEGEWKIDVADRDTSWLAASALAPPFSARGAGRFSADPFARVGEASGQLSAAASRPVPSFPAVGLLRLDATFDAALTASAVRVRKLDARLAGGACAASVQALEPFELAWRGGALNTGEKQADWLKVSVQGLPLAWLPAHWGGYALDAGTLAGAFTVSAGPDGYGLRSQAPLAAQGVTLSHDGRTLARGLDLTLGLAGNYAADQWKLHAAPLALARSGQALASLDATLSRAAGESQPLALAATWRAQLPGLAAAGLLPPWLSGRSASGECTASIGQPLAIECKLDYVGLDPQDTVTLDLETQGDPSDGSMSVKGPVRIATGPKVSEFTVDGIAGWEDDAPMVNLRLSGKTAVAEHFGAAAALLTTAAGGHLPSLSPAGTGRDAAPFWGALNGGVAAEFETLQAGPRQFTQVAGALEFGRDSMKLEHVRVVWSQDGKPKVAHMDAALSFDPAAPEPYRLKGSGTLEELEVAKFFGPSLNAHGPLAEGRFTTVAQADGAGANLAGLVRNARLQVQLTSTTAILRALGTNVAERIPESDKTTVGERAGIVGTSVGEFFGMEPKDGVAKGRRNILAKNTDAVLLLNSQLAELGFDRVTATVVLAPGGALQLTQLEMVSPDLRLTGTGRMDADPGVPLRQRPLTAELRLGLRGAFSDALAQSGLPVGPKDHDGYAVLRDPIRLAGTLTHLDTKGWSDVLLQAALPKPAERKPGG